MSMQVWYACRAHIRSLAAKPLIQIVKLPLLCVLIFLTIKWCNQSSLMRWIASIAVVVGLRLCAEHVDVCKRQGPRQHDRYLASVQPGHLNTSDAQARQLVLDSLRRALHTRNRDEWRAAVGSQKVASAWEKFCNSIVQEFIYDSWFCQLSPDREFPACVRWQINHAFGEICKRAQSKRLDWTSILIRDCSAALCSTLQLYRNAADLVGAEKLKSLPAPEADAAIREVLSKARKLHPAFSNPEGQYRTCKRLSEAVLMHIIPQEDRACPIIRSLLRELFATCVLRSVLASLAPYSINRMLLNILGAGMGPKALGQEQLDAAAEFELRGCSSCKAEEDHLNHSKAGQTSGKPQLPAAGKSQHSPTQVNVTVSNGMKRSKSLGDVKESFTRFSGRGWATGSLTTAKQPGSKWRERSGISPVRGASAVLAVGQHGQQMLADGVGAVKAAAQQLTQRRRVGSDARLGSKPSSSPSSWLPGDSPRSCTSAADVSCSPDLISRLAAVARGVSTGGLGCSPGAAGLGSWGDTTSSAASSVSGSAAGNSASRSPVVASSANSSTSGSNSIKAPVVAALCGMSRPPFSPTRLEGSAGPVMQQLMFGKLHAQVASAEMLSQEGKDIIVYKVRVTDERGEWTVTRRYRHFEVLHKRLKDTRHYKDLPVALPPKRLLTARDAPFVLKRRDELNCYLQGLLQSQCLTSNYELAEFLSQSSEVYGLAAAADRLQSIRPPMEGSSPAQCTESENPSQLPKWQDIFATEQDFSNGSSGCSAQQQQLLGHQPERVIPGAAKCSSSGTMSTANTSCSSRNIEGANCPSMHQAVCNFDLPATLASAAPDIVADNTMHAAAQQGLEVSIADTKTTQCVQFDKSPSCQQQPGDLAAGQAAAAANKQQHCNTELLLQQQQEKQWPGQLQALGLPEEWAPAAGKGDGGLGCADTALALKPADMQGKQHGCTVHISCAQQPWQRSNKRQQLLEQTDSVDPSFFSQQAAVPPHLPSSAPVPNRILPQSSTMLHTVSSVRSPGAVRALSKQEADAAHCVEAAEQLTRRLSQQLHSIRADCGSLACIGSNSGCSSCCSRQTGDQQQQQLACWAVVSRPCCQAQLGSSRHSGSTGEVVSRVGSMPSRAPVTVQPQLQQQTAQCYPAATPQLAPQQASKVSSSYMQQSQTSMNLEGGTCATKQGNSKPCTLQASSHTAAPGSKGECWWASDGADWPDSMQDSTGLIEPLYELVSCAFELQSKGFVRRPVLAGVRGLLSFVAGGAIDEFIQKKLKVGLSEENLSRQLHRLQAQLWPGGVFFARANAAAAVAAAATAGNTPGGLPPRGPPISAERFLDWVPPPDSDQVAEQVRQRLLASSVPGPLLALVGKQDYYKCLGDIYGVLQSKTLMYNLGLTLIETLLVAMWPELKSTIMQMHAFEDV